MSAQSPDLSETTEDHRTEPVKRARMNSDDSNRGFESSRRSSPTELEVSAHAWDSWNERGDDRSPREALQLSTRTNLVYADGTPAYDADELRLYAPGDRAKPLVFIVREDTVVTVVPPRREALPDGRLERCAECTAVHTLVTECGCPYCSPVVRAIQRGIDT